MIFLLLRRLVQTALILFGVAAITFLCLYALPADPARMIAGRSATAQTVANIRHELGLDQPLLSQFWTYLKGCPKAISAAPMRRNRCRRADRCPSSGNLDSDGGRIAVEVVLGLCSASSPPCRRGGPVDRFVMMASFVGVSAPQFVAALLPSLCLCGHAGLVSDERLWHLCPCRASRHHARHSGGRWYARMVRSAMIDVLNQIMSATAVPRACRPPASSFAMRCRMRSFRSSP